MNRLADLFADLPLGVRGVAVVAAATLCGLAAHALLFRSAGQLGQRAPALLVFDGVLLRRSRGPARLLFPLLAV